MVQDRRRGDVDWRDLSHAELGKSSKARQSRCIRTRCDIFQGEVVSPRSCSD